MAQQYVQFQATNPDFDPLLVNLAENVKHRRNMEMMKAQQAESLQQDMATGLAPKADFSITDEGLEIKAMDVDGVTKTGRDASNAFYKAMGNMFGNNDMTQEAKSETSTEISDPSDKIFKQGTNLLDQQNARLAGARETNSILRAEQIGMVHKMPATGGQGNLSTTLDTVRSASSLGPIGSANSSPQQSVIETLINNGLAKGVQATGVIADQLRGQATPSGDGTATNNNSTGTNRTNTRLSTSTSAGGRIGGGYRGMIQQSDKLPGLDVSAPITGIVNTTSQGARIDEIKTSLTNLAGLASFRKTFGGDADNAYSKLYDQRVKDLERWEESALSTTAKLEKLGDAKIKVGGAESGAQVASSEYGQTNVITTVTAKGGEGGGNQNAADRTLLYTAKNGEKQKVFFDENYNLSKGVTSLQLGGDSFDSEIAQKKIATVGDLETLFKSRITTDELKKGIYKFERVPGSTTELVVKVKANNKTYNVTFKNTGTFQKMENGESKSAPRWLVNAPVGLPVRDLEYLLQAVGQ